MGPWWLTDLLLAEIWHCKPWEVGTIEDHTPDFWERFAWRRRATMYYNMQAEKQSRK